MARKKTRRSPASAITGTGSRWRARGARGATYRRGWSGGLGSLDRLRIVLPGFRLVRFILDLFECALAAGWRGRTHRGVELWLGIDAGAPGFIFRTLWICGLHSYSFAAPCQIKTVSAT